MMDYLKRICLDNGIKVIYTKNDSIILSPFVSNGTVIIKVYYKFMDCPENVADAILGYYVKDQKKYLKILEGYIEDDLFLIGYQIAPPTKAFSDIIKSMTDDRKEKEKEALPTLEEANIISFLIKDAEGNVKTRNPDNVFKTFDESVAEIDIIIRNNTDTRN